MGDWDLLDPSHPEDGGGLRSQGKVPELSPWFDGHFPDCPILPGVAMLHAMIELLGCDPSVSTERLELRNVRFRQATGPGAALAGTVSPPAADGRRRFELLSNGALACSGVMRPERG
ncbi:MAG: hypothetical protein JW751_04670 [Polyangiaceae bacterium]|nr:hypothetical protein [Polyangiaceae bacterium]